jgi:hypothetical protein
MTVRLSALHTGRALLHRNIIFQLLVLISVRSWLNLKDLARPEELDKLQEKFIILIESRTCDLPACSIVPQSPRYRVPQGHDMRCF